MFLLRASEVREQLRGNATGRDRKPRSLDRRLVLRDAVRSRWMQSLKSSDFHRQADT